MTKDKILEEFWQERSDVFAIAHKKFIERVKQQESEQGNKTIEQRIYNACISLDDDVESNHLMLDGMMVNVLSYIIDGGDIDKEALQFLVDTFEKTDKWYA